MKKNLAIIMVLVITLFISCEEDSLKENEPISSFNYPTYFEYDGNTYQNILRNPEGEEIFNDSTYLVIYAEVDSGHNLTVLLYHESIDIYSDQVVETVSNSYGDWSMSESADDNVRYSRFEYNHWDYSRYCNVRTLGGFISGDSFILEYYEDNDSIVSKTKTIIIQ